MSQNECFPVRAHTASINGCFPVRFRSFLKGNIHSGLHFTNDVIEVGVTCTRGTFVCVLYVCRGVSKSLRHGECNVVIKKVTTHKSYFNGTGAQAGG